jgi:hypothetical protein
MKNIVVTSLAAITALVGVALSSAAVADDPSWPPGQMKVFVSAQTWTGVNKLENFFPQGAGVHFFVTAVDLKTRQDLAGKDVKWVHVLIPKQPNLKLTWQRHGTGKDAPFAFMGTWTIPLDYQVGLVPFQVVVKTKTNRYGSFLQAPVAAAQLTVIAKT